MHEPKIQAETIFQPKSTPECTACQINKAIMAAPRCDPITCMTVLAISSPGVCGVPAVVMESPDSPYFLSGFAGAAVTVPNLDDIADIPFSSLTKVLGKDRSPATIVRGCFDFPADASFSSRAIIEVPLVTAGDIFRPVHRTTQNVKYG